MERFKWMQLLNLILDNREMAINSATEIMSTGAPNNRTPLLQDINKMKKLIKNILISLIWI